MRAKRLFKYFVVALVVLLMIIPVMVSAKTTEVKCSGKETLDFMLNPGVWSFPDGNIHVRGMVSQYTEEMDCPGMSGTNTVTMNANWDGNYIGPMWGTNYLETTDGAWKGSWSGKLYPDGTLAYTGVSRGISGSAIGLLLNVHGYTEEPNGPTLLEITISNPGGN